MDNDRKSDLKLSAYDFEKKVNKRNLLRIYYLLRGLNASHPQNTSVREATSVI